MVKFSGALKDQLGNPRKGVVGLTFSLYKDQQAGPPLWLEVQNAQLDEQGRYTVLLGATRGEGLPLDLFLSGEARWLGVQANLPGEEEQPRVLLVSVPYALKAADAETLGGKAVSAFLLAEGHGPDSATVSLTAVPPDRLAITGTPGRIAKFNSSGNDVVDTVAPIFESGTNIGIGTTTPGHKLHIYDASATATRQLRVDDSSGDRGGIQLGNYVSLQGHLDGDNNWHRALFAEGVYWDHVSNVYRLTSAAFDRAAIELLNGGHIAFFGEAADRSASPTFTPAAWSALERMRITSGGNVGIGTTAPTEKLEVAGNLKVSGAGNGVIFPDGTTQTSACGTLFSRPLLTSLRSFLQSGIPQSGSQDPFQGLPQFAQAASCGDFSEVFMELISKLEERRTDLARLQSEMEGLKTQLERLLGQTTK